MMLGRLRHSAAGCDAVSGLAATLRVVWGGGNAAAPAAAGWSRGFAVPSHMPDPNEKWPEGRRAAEGWWEDPAISTAAQAFEIFDASLEKHRHLRQRHVQEIIKRCQSAEDLQLAVNAMDKLMRFRRAEQHHKAFNTHTGKMFVERAIALQSGDVAAQAFRRSAELGLSPGTIQVQMVAKQLGTQGKLDELNKLLAAARKLGIRMTPTMAYTLALTAIQVGQAERGQQLIKEMELNGVRIRPIVHRHLANALSSAGDAAAAAPAGEAADGSEAADGAPAADGVPAGADATSSAAAEAPEQPSPEQRKEEGATPEAAAGAPPGVAS